MVSWSVSTWEGLPLHLPALAAVVGLVGSGRGLGTRGLAWTAGAGGAAAIDQHHGPRDRNALRPDAYEASGPNQT